MNIDNKRRVQALVKEVGAHLDGKLPSLMGLTKRNPYAHVWERIMDKYGMSYRDIDDALVDDVLAFVEYLRDNPN